MNPRQRRGVLLLLVTLLGAALTFVGVAAYVNSVSSQVGPMTKVLQLTTDIKPMHKIEEKDVELVELPKRWAPSKAVSSFGQIEGLVSGGTFTAGSVIQEGMLIEQPGLKEGNREISIKVDAETGVAGHVSPGDHVDIVAATESKEGTDNEDRVAEIVVENALVTDVGEIQATRGEGASGDYSEGKQVPMTFSLTPEQTLRVTYAEAFAKEVRISLRGTGDSGALSQEQKTYKGPNSNAQQAAGSDGGSGEQQSATPPKNGQEGAGQR